MPQATRNRAGWITLITVGLLLLIGGLAVPKKSKTPPPPPPPPADSRALVLPKDGIQRTVVVPACGATSASAPGYVRFVVGGDGRAVLVPDCSAKANPQTGAPQQASAFVLPVGANVLVDRPASVGVRQQVLVPANSKAHTVVVPACAAGTTVRPNAKRQDTILSPASGSSATAPAC